METDVGSSGGPICIINENNEFKLGNIISVFKLPDIDREFALFSLEDYDTDIANLHVAYLNKDTDGYDYITEIDDDKIYKKAMLVVKDMMEVINNG